MGTGEAVTSMLWEDYLSINADDSSPILIERKSDSVISNPKRYSIGGLFPLYPWQRWPDSAPVPPHDIPLLSGLQGLRCHCGVIPQPL